ncbi:MAG: exo-alpha-sialidase [Opitutus sp.]|nr:exo-alpha-sialidase [Opitutus sp.]
MITRLPACLALCALILTRSPAAEIPHAAQPQLAAIADGRVWLAFGRGKEILVARSDDQGSTFAAPVQVAALPSLMLGKRRGPRIAAHSDHVTVTAMAGELFAFHSKDAGKTWAGPIRVNDVPRSAREGLNGLAVAPDGRLFTTWLDLRGERTQLFSAESTDGGASWSANQLVYRAPAGQTVCECCHPSAHFNARGDLIVMWRNGVDGARDMWSTVRSAGAKDFGAAAKLGEGTWILKACPMDGGVVFPQGEGFASIWQRDGAVYFSRPGNAEVHLGRGLQPVAIALGGETLAFWQQGPDLWSTRIATTPTAPAKHAASARFPTLIAAPGGGALLAYERGTGVVVERN